MTTTPNELLAAKQKEMLIVLMALSFIESDALMSPAQLKGTKKSLQAVFIRTSGEETILRKLIDLLRVNRDRRAAFGEIAKISAAVSSSVETITRKLDYLKQYVSSLPLTPEENEQFFAPFLSFTHRFQQTMVTLNYHMLDYLEACENEAKTSQEFVIAQQASERLKHHLSGSLGSSIRGDTERSIKDELISTFDHDGARARFQTAQRDTREKTEQIDRTLLDLKAMCQMAMNPEMRDRAGRIDEELPKHDDIFVLFARALQQYPRMQQVKELITEYLRLYQRTYGIFALRYENFRRAIETISGSPEDYFSAKREDEDIRVKEKKLKRIEGLIPFLERANVVLSESDELPFPRFSRRVSQAIAEPRAAWYHISEPLLQAKITAEADLTTRLSPA